MKKRIGSYPRVCVEGGGRAVVSQAGACCCSTRRAGWTGDIGGAGAVAQPGRCTTRARSCWMWRSRSPSAGTASRTWECCGPNRPCSGRWPPTRRSPVSSTPSPRRETRPWRHSVRHAPKSANTSGSWPEPAAPDAGGQVIVDLVGVLVLAHSEKQDATATWKKTFGHHPLMGFVDHGAGGSGEPVAALLRPGNAGSNTAADHITTAQLALAQLPKKFRRGRQTLIRTDSGGGTHEFLAWLTKRGPVAVVLGRHDHHRRHPPGRPARFPPRRGRWPSSRAARSATAPGWPSWTATCSRAGRRACG